MATKAHKKSAKKAARKKAATKAARKSAKKATATNLHAKGGGAAPAAGVTHQGWVGGLFAAIGLEQAPVDPRLQLQAETISEVRLETDSPIDDLILSTTAPGRLFVQAKTNVSLGKTKSSEMVKTIDQFVRQWRLCCEGKKSRGWDYPLDKDRDRFVIAVGTEAPATVGIHLANALLRRREGATPYNTPKNQREALAYFTALIKASWKKIYGTAAKKQDIDSILDLAVVIKFDFSGADFAWGELLLRNNVAQKKIARAAFTLLAHECEQRMWRRTSFTIREIRRFLEQSGVELLAPEDYRKEVEALRKKSQQFRKDLSTSARLDIGEGDSIPIPREVSGIAKTAAEAGSFLLVGEPGAGKTGVLVELAHQLEPLGGEVLLLKVAASGLTGLKADLGLTHPLQDILENWPGVAPAYLLIDGLDEARGGPADTEYRNLIAEVLGFPDHRWKLVASVRSFDLRAGLQYRSLFKGTPPSSEFAASGADLANVRQIEVRPWSEAEFGLLMAKAPKLRRAIEVAGAKLREIALVPFNTQLLAEVISLGASDEELGTIRNQRDLLAKYWDHRIAPFGGEGKGCLTSIIEGMVAERGVEADAGPIERNHGAMLDSLQQAGVVVPRRNGRQIAFRHNILFDYVASRLYLDPFKPERLQGLFLRDRGLGLILGPALGYALQELWDYESDHQLFWALLTLLVSDKNVDPIARSLASRRAVEFTRSIADIQGFADNLPDSKASGEVQTSLVGAFTILFEDSPHEVSPEPWSYLALCSSTKAALVGTTTTLVERLLKSEVAAEVFARLGKAARNLLEFGFASPKPNPNYVAFCVPLVANTYTTDPVTSKGLLDKVFEPERMAKNAHIEVPALARCIGTIAKYDPEFAIAIYGKVFSHRVGSGKDASFSNSQIMPMSTGASDMYGTATYALASHFPLFLEDNLSAATEAAIGVVEGYIATRHPIPATVQQKTIQADGATAQLIEDRSGFWAWEIDNTHPDSFQMIVQRFIAELREADAERAKEIVAVFVAKNRSALLWARLLMVAADRPEIFAPLLWDLATHEAVLLCSDTRKDAVDAIAKFYPLRTDDDRRAFEENVLTYGAADLVYQSVRQDILETLFQMIGEQNVVTDSVRVFATPKEGEPPAFNHRPFAVHGGPVEYSFFERLKDNGVDVAATANSTLLGLIDEINAAYGFANLPRPQFEDSSAGIAGLRRLRDGIAAAEADHANEHILGRARQMLSNGNLAVLESAQRAKASIADVDLQASLEIALSFAEDDARNARDSLRELAVVQLYLLSQYPSASKKAIKRVEELATDADPVIRKEVARNLATLFNLVPAKVWKLAEFSAKHEETPIVLAQLVASCLGSLRNLDPKRVESMVLRIRERFPYELLEGDGDRDPRSSLWKVSAEVIAGLYVWNDRKKSRDELFAWAADPLNYEDQIRNALFFVRQAVTQGYDSNTPAFEAARLRVHELLQRVVDHAAAALEKYRALSSKMQKKKKEEGLRYAKCLEYACASLFFASGAFRESNMGNTSPVLTDAGKGNFVRDFEPMLRRLGDIAIPHTIYELVQLLDYTLAGDPELSFDLFAHALTVSGQKHGFQGEQLGVDVLVRVVSRCLADYDYIFRDKVRRDRLIACLDIFIEAGWPNALRLIYRLPDSLR
jgi:hypothetical protein